jgi:hypothetical protein
MTLRLNGNTSGYTEIDAPAVAGSNTLLLPAGNGNAFQIMRNGATAGSLEFSDKIVSGTAVASTSGTAIDFTGIPSWVKRVTVMFDGVSTTSTSPIGVAVGTSAGFITSGYQGGASNQSATFTANTNCLLINTASIAAGAYRGHAILTLISSNRWIFSAGVQNGSTNLAGAGGAITLSGTLDRVRITTVNGTDTFDAGSINIMYE